MADYAKLQALGIDTEEGLAYCAEDPEFYEEMLGEYGTEGLKDLEELARFFRSEDWKNYGIRAHTVKSTSRMIGAQALSEQARMLEAAAKEGSVDRIREAHAPFLEAYGTLLAGLREALG